MATIETATAPPPATSWSFGSRQVQAEWMDEPALSDQAHHHALKGLARINWWSGSGRIVWSGVRRLTRATGQTHLTVLDVATGGGDVPLALWRRAKRAGLDLRIVACDLSEVALDHAQRQARKQRAHIEFVRLDALHDDFPGNFDVVCSSLFMHHLRDQDAVRLLSRMRAAARRVVLVNDLLRTPAAYALALVATRLFTRSPVVHVDGPRSVANGFTRDEARRLAEQAGLHNAAIHWRWPFRFLLQWQHETASNAN